MQEMSTRAAEVAAVTAQLWKLPSETAERFQACKASHRFMAFIGKQLIIYKVAEDGTACDVIKLTCKDVYVDGNEGFASEWVTEPTDTEDSVIYSIDYTPTELAPGVFMWTTFNSSVQMTSHRGQKSLRFSMLYSCGLHPATKVQGVHYIQERAAFDLEF